MQWQEKERRIELSAFGQSISCPLQLAYTAGPSRQLLGIRARMSELASVAWATVHRVSQQKTCLQLAACSLKGPARQTSEHTWVLRDPVVLVPLWFQGRSWVVGERHEESRSNCYSRLTRCKDRVPVKNSDLELNKALSWKGEASSLWPIRIWLVPGSRPGGSPQALSRTPSNGQTNHWGTKRHKLGPVLLFQFRVSCPHPYGSCARSSDSLWRHKRSMGFEFQPCH